MDPFTIAAIVALISGAVSGAVGYSFGSAAKEERFKELQELIAKQARIIAEHEKTIQDLCRQIGEIPQSRGLLRRFMWFVFKSDPKLYALFAELERSERSRGDANNGLVMVVSTLKTEFPDHPASKAYPS